MREVPLRLPSSIDLDNLSVEADSPSIPWFQRVIARVLRRAAVDYVLCYENESVKLREVGDEAYDWLFRDNQGFLDACEVLAMTPERVREHVLRLSTEQARALRGLEFGDTDRGPQNYV